MASSARFARLMVAGALCLGLAGPLAGCASADDAEARPTGSPKASASAQATQSASPEATASQDAAELLARAAEANDALAQATATPVVATGTWTAEVDGAEGHEQETRAYAFSALTSPAAFERIERIAADEETVERTFLAEPDPANAEAFLTYSREGEGPWTAGSASAADFPGQAIGNYAALRLGSLLTIVAKQPENVKISASKSTITLEARPKDEVRDELVQEAFGAAATQWGDSFEADTATLVVTLDVETLTGASLSLDAAGSAVRGEDSREIAFREECSYDREPAADAVAIPDEARAAGQLAPPAQ